jgi:hypothetical protein
MITLKLLIRLLLMKQLEQGEYKVIHMCANRVLLSHCGPVDWRWAKHAKVAKVLCHAVDDGEKQQFPFSRCCKDFKLV